MPRVCHTSIDLNWKSCIACVSNRPKFSIEMRALVRLLYSRFFINMIYTNALNLQWKLYQQMYTQTRQLKRIQSHLNWYGIKCKSVEKEKVGKLALVKIAMIMLIYIFSLVFRWCVDWEQKQNHYIEIRQNGNIRCNSWECVFAGCLHYVLWKPHIYVFISIYCVIQTKRLYILLRCKCTHRTAYGMSNVAVHVCMCNTHFVYQYMCLIVQHVVYPQYLNSIWQQLNQALSLSHFYGEERA